MHSALEGKGAKNNAELKKHRDIELSPFNFNIDFNSVAAHMKPELHWPLFIGSKFS